MGTETHRETKRLAGMGRTSCTTRYPTPNRSSGGLGAAKDLTRVGTVPAPDLLVICPCYTSSIAYMTIYESYGTRFRLCKSPIR